MRTSILVSFAVPAFATLLGLGACSPYSPDLGVQPFLCDSVEPLCPEGYGCQLDMGSQMMVCVATGAMPIDAGPVGFQCRDDVGLEGPNKNDTIEHAFVTSVATSRSSIVFASALCPEGDKDVYQVMTTAAMQNVQVVVSWDSGLPLSAAILNNGGTAIANATSNGANSVKAFAANLPLGIYYGQVFAGATTKNNYRVEISVTGP